MTVTIRIRDTGLRPKLGQGYFMELMFSLHFILYRGQPKGHGTASWSHHHVLGVKLNTLHRTLVIAIEDTNLLAVLAVPDVDAAVAGAGDDELRVGGEGGLQGQLLGVEVTCECLKGCSIIWINQFYNWAVSRDQDWFSIGREFEACPLDFLTISL